MEEKCFTHDTFDCPKCAQNETTVSKSASVTGYKALYWIDFKSKKEEIRLQLEAVNLEQAKKRAREIIGRRFKMKEACCVR